MAYQRKLLNNVPTPDGRTLFNPLNPHPWIQNSHIPKSVFTQQPATAGQHSGAFNRGKEKRRPSSAVPPQEILMAQNEQFARRRGSQ